MECFFKIMAWLGVTLLTLVLFEPICFAQIVSEVPNALRNTAKEFVARKLAAGEKANRLIGEKSPYLLQHAFNPVDWYPWGEDAFAKARRENKPIFLSIGYSTCHWCHVMAHESFDNKEIAEILNRYFIAIKIDREERPDLDQVYMAVTQAMTGSGGWPMSLFLTPELQPFFAGTYFPAHSKYGRPGFSELLTSINTAWQENPANIAAKAAEIMRRVRASTADDGQIMEVGENVVETAARSFAGIYDKRHGGFGNAPKFPRPVSLFFLLRYYQINKDRHVLEMLSKTMQEMANGGMYDQIGGGFHRYSVDRAWRVPHFEKMLYDQAQLAKVYFEMYQVSGERDYLGVAQEILDYVRRDLTDPEGGFFSAEDADSPLPEDPSKHGEGAFYSWSGRELAEIIDAQKMKIFFGRYGVLADGNVELDPQGEFGGKNILYVKSSLSDLAAQFKLTVAAVRDELASAKKILLKVRGTRPRPHLDDKILVSWNGLMISAFSQGYHTVHGSEYLQAALASATFVWQKLYDPEKMVLYHRYRDGDAGIEATLDDYAFLIQGFLDLFEASSDYVWLERAELLSRLQDKYFADRERGGFFDTSGRDATVLLRMKSDYDGAEPTGNSVAALNYLRLGEILASQEDKTRGEQTIKAFGSQLREAPYALPQLLVAQQFQQGKPLHIVVVGKRDDRATEEMLKVVNSFFLPQRTIFLLDGDGQLPQILKDRPDLAAMSKIDGRATAFVCEGVTCRPPTNDVAVLAEMLSKL